MSTHVALSSSAVTNALENTLHRWRPTSPILTAKAHLFLAPQPAQRISGDWPGQRPEALRGNTEAAFDNYIEDGRPPWGLFKDTFGRSGVSQMEVLSPNPGVRLFGAFVIDDTCFVGLRLLFRDELPFKPTGQRGIVDYRALGAELVSEWEELLPGIARLPMREL